MASSLGAGAKSVTALVATVSCIADSVACAAVASVAWEAFLRCFATTTTGSAVGLTESMVESRKAITSAALAIADQVASIVGRQAVLESRAKSATAEVALAAEKARALANHDLHWVDGDDGGSPSTMNISSITVTL
ncbi:unnamed protein product [Urochloa humidicola]